MNGPVTPPDRLNARELEILRRLAAGLSDQQIADELYLSFNTVRWYNRQIYSKLGVSSRTQAIARASGLGWLDEQPTPPALPPRQRLPVEVTPFIGRQRAIAAVKQLLSGQRLLTLSGPGGTGKTRLALRVAAEVADAFADGVVFVDLAPLSDSALVADAFAAALGVAAHPTEPLQTTLKRALARQEILLLIDNFEHVLPAAPLVSELLASCPRLKLLVTSREPLRLAGEQEYPVRPLSLPDIEAVSAQDVTLSEAGALFVQRAQMTLPEFQVTDINAEAVARICVRLDGLPLAIELAAARCKLLTPQALLERLDMPRQNPLLRTLAAGSRDAPGRQRSLRDSIQWSYSLLTGDEKTLFAWLAVFRGGCSLDAVEAVCGGETPSDVFDTLASLVDKSLVQQRESSLGDLRFILLEMVHEFALERLEASCEVLLARRRAAEYFAALARRAEPELRLSRYDDWCRRFELELDNLRNALEWSLEEGDVTLGVQLAADLGLFWYGKGRHVEGIGWMQRLMARLDEAPLAAHPPFLISAAQMAFMVDLTVAGEYLSKAAELSRSLGDTRHYAWALTFLGYTRQRVPEAAIPLVEEALDLFRQRSDLPGIAQALNIIGEIARINGDDERARDMYEACLDVCRKTGEIRRTGYLCNNLAYIAQHAGQHERALALARESLRLAHERQDRYDMAKALVTIAGSVAIVGQPDAAARLLGTIDLAFQRLGAFQLPSDQPEIERVTAAVRAQLNDTAYREAWAVGQRTSLTEVVEQALAGTL